MKRATRMCCVCDRRYKVTLNNCERSKWCPRCRRARKTELMREARAAKRADFLAAWRMRQRKLVQQRRKAALESAELGGVCRDSLP